MSGPRSFQEIIDAHPVSNLQAALFALCFLVAGIDGFDVALIGFLAPAVAKSLHLAPPQLAPVFAAGQFGTVAGALLIGPLADRFGRKRLMLVSVLVFGVMTVLTAQSADLATLVLMRFLTGIGLGGALPCATALTAEFCPTRKRATLTTAMFCGFTFGSAIGGLVTAWAEPLLGWQGVFGWAGLMSLALLPVLLAAIPESAEHLARSPANAARLERILRRIAGRAINLTSLSSDHGAQAGRPVRLFASRPIRGIVLLWITSFMTLLVVYLLSSWMPTMLTSKGISLQHAALATAMFQIGGTIGAVGLGVLMDRFEPRKVLATGFVFAGLFVAAIGLLSANVPVLAMFIFLAGACVSGGQVGVMAYTAAWYPAAVRATGVSWTNAGGRIGSIVGSLAGGALLDVGLQFSAILALLAVPAFAAAVAIVWHGRGEQLEEPVPEATVPATR